MYYKKGMCYFCLVNAIVSVKKQERYLFRLKTLLYNEFLYITDFLIQIFTTQTTQ